MPFGALKLHPSLLAGIKDLGFAKPTPIQSDAIPPALSGRDVLACAMTGSGKTAAFVLPILHRLLAKPLSKGTRALIIGRDFREFNPSSISERAGAVLRAALAR